MYHRLEAAAVEMIRLAVEPVSSVVPLPLASGARIERPDMEIQLPDGDRVALELKRWGVPPRREQAPGTVLVWVLDRSAPELRRRLRESDENFVDLSGLVRLHLPGLLIDRSDLEGVRGFQGTETRNPFADRASRVPRTLFAASIDRSWSIQELSEAAGVSLGMASYVVNALEERGVVGATRVAREKRVRLEDRRSLILQWTAQYTWRRDTAVAFDAPLGSPQRFMRRLPGLLEGAKWALTLQAGASLVLPHARWDTVHIYVRGSPERIRGIGSDLGWRPSHTGKVVLLAPYYADSVWFGTREVDGLPVVSDLQLMLDLWHYPVRGREQAEMLLERHVSTRA